MLRITQRFHAPAAEISDQLSLPFDLRKRGRFKAVTTSGRDIGLFIERGQVLADGDLLLTDCGQVIQVIAQAEPVVTARSDDWLQFARVCYHLGNRHVPLQVGERWLRFQPDHVLQDLAELYGLSTRVEQVPFAPENGAYGAHGGHSHGDQQPHAHDAHSHGDHADKSGQGHDHHHQHSR